MIFSVPVEAAAVAIVLVFSASAAAGDVVAVVSSRSAITTLSKAQLMDIFLGNSGRFPNGTPAIPIDQADGSGAREEFYATYAGKSPAQVKSHWAKIIFTGRGQPPKTAATDAEIKQLIAANPQAVGYIERGAVDGTVRVLTEL
jgi:ABC-type phosphate transport system substrate-binding protein